MNRTTEDNAAGRDNSTVYLNQCDSYLPVTTRTGV
jgi:hypothetical protein